MAWLHLYFLRKAIIELFGHISVQYLLRTPQTKHNFQLYTATHVAKSLVVPIKKFCFVNDVSFYFGFIYWQEWEIIKSPSYSGQ